VSNEGIFGATADEDFGSTSVVVVVFFMVVVGPFFGIVIVGAVELTVGTAICPTGARVVFTEPTGARTTISRSTTTVVVVVVVVVVDVVVVVGAGMDTVIDAGEPARVVVALPDVSATEKVDDLVIVTVVEDEAATDVDRVTVHFFVDCCVMEVIVPPVTVRS
jgi:hypothetical protein